jgi:hypothetical protein
MTRLKAKLEALAEGDRSAGDILRCSQPFCSNLSMHSAGEGFSLTLCKYHTERLATHGDATVPSISGPLLRQYVDTARRWIKAELKTGNIRVSSALTAIEGLLSTAGPAISAHDIKHLSANTKARSLFAHLRENAVPSERILGSHMGIVALLQDDTWAPRSEEYRLVQSAKAIKRCASGTHLKYEIAAPVPVSALAEGEEAPTQKVVIRAYPRSAGQYLRLVGKALDEACGAIAEDTAPAIIALKDTRFGIAEHRAPGYRPEWRRKDIEKHAEALKQRQQAEHQANAQAQRQADIRTILGDAFGPSMSWHHR